MRSLAPMMLTVLATAGCYGMCGYTPESAAWTEPGLYAWLGAGPLEGAVLTDGDAGLPFAGEIDGVRPDAVRSLSWHRDTVQATPDIPAMTLDPDGQAWSTGTRLAEPDVRLLFRGFAEDVSAANATILDQAEDDFVASREAGVAYTVDANGTEIEIAADHYRALLPGPYRLEALAHETGATFGPYVPEPYREPGTAYANGGGYGWTFTLPFWRVPLGDGAMSVDLLDRVRVDGIFAENDEDADIERKVRRAFDEAGVPEPHLEGMTHGGSIC